MSITNGYCTLIELKAALPNMTGVTAHDTYLELCVETASRMIDGHCNRRFYTTASDEARYYTAAHYDCVGVLDVISITTLQTDSDGDGTIDTTWAATDYVLYPRNNALDGLPYSKINVSPSSTNYFPTVQDGVKITGKFGFATAPKGVKQACIIQASRLFARKDAPFGVTGGGEFGQAVSIASLDPDVKMQLAPFMRYV